MANFVQSWKTGKPERSARIGFASPELLWQVLTAKRWELLKILCGAGPISIREAARRVERDVKAVHADITALLNAGVLDRAEGEASSFHSKQSRSSSCLKQRREVAAGMPTTVAAEEVGVGGAVALRREAARPE